MGLPVARVEFIDEASDASFETVEDFKEDLDRVLKELKDVPALYILDSLDALSDRAELVRDLDKGSYGANKAKMMSRIFRGTTREIAQKKLCLLIISQVRDNIGVTFGESHVRSGGKALDFYASQVLWLFQKKRISKTRKGIERVVGVQIRARCKKNKVGLPFRECDFPIYFGFGVDDVTAGIEWLKSVKRLDAVGLDETTSAQFIKGLPKLSDAEYGEDRQRVNQAVVDVWKEVEESFKPVRQKYR